MNAPLVQSLNLRIKGGSASERIASLIVLALELDHLHRKQGYAGIGSWQQFREEYKSGERLTWLEFCKKQAGFTDTAVKKFLECGEAVKLRLRLSRDPSAKDLLWAMEIPPSEHTKEQRENLIVRIVELGLTPGDTQTYLRKEYRAANPKNGTKPLGANPWPADDGDELYKKALRLKPVVEKESDRRETERREHLARLAMQALAHLKATGRLHHLNKK